MANLETLVGVLTPIFRGRSTDHWLKTLARHGVPAGPIASVGEMLDHPQTQAREMVVEVDHPKAGRTRSLGNPVKLSVPPGGADPDGAGAVWAARPAPTLGQHTGEVLLDAGFTADELSALEASGAVRRGDGDTA
jgi:crotonobetainyl-CoA:carnitine CoA-transferase CaiB-like acyl-CoA transferase